MKATYSLMVDWNGDGSFSGLYDNVTKDMISAESRCGRDYASQLTGRASAGKLSVILHNASGLYSLLYPSSPLYGLALPGRKIKLIAEFDSSGGLITQTLWSGFLSNITPRKDLYKMPVVELEAVGPLEKLSGVQIIPGAQANKTTGEIIDIILDYAGWPSGERAVDTGQTTISRWFVDKKDTLNSIRDVEETELGFFYERNDGYLVFEDRHHRLKGDSLTSQATFSDDGLGDASFRGIEYDNPLREVYNDVVSTVSPLQANGGSVILWTLREDPPGIAPGQSLTWWAEYPNAEIDPENGAYVDEWDTPVAGVDVIASGVASSSIGISVSKFANSMKITLTNNGAAPATITTFQAKGLPVKYKEPVRVSDEDTTSQGKYGIKTYKLPGPWLPDTNNARDFCRYVISRYKDPLPVIQLSFKANKDERHMIQALNRKISDRVKVRVTSPRIPFGINGEFFIEAISHRITQWGGVHEVFFDLSDASGDSGYWILGVPGFSELGETTRVGY